MLLFAPGGLRSRMEMWPSPAGRAASVVGGLDAGTAGGGVHRDRDGPAQRRRSRTAIEADHGWHTYAADHLALMDHLGFEKFHVLGGCIGGSFCLKAVEVAPKRVTVGGAAEPDRRASGASGRISPKSHAEWSREQRAARPELNEEALAAFGRNMWDHPIRFLRRSGVRQQLPGADDPACRARIFRTRRRPARNWRRCCRGWRC